MIWIFYYMKKFKKKKIAIYQNRRENSEEYPSPPIFLFEPLNLKNLKITHSYIHAINFIEMYKKNYYRKIYQTS